MKKCVVGAETVRMLELGHPWVIADRYTRQWPAGRAGDLIALSDSQGKFLATALYDPDERIVARVLARSKMRLDLAWLKGRLLAARELRAGLALDGTDAYRLVNGEGDLLPGLTLDRYADFIMLQLYSAAWDPHLPLLQQALEQVFSPRGIYSKPRPQQTRALEAKGKSKHYSRLVSGTPAVSPLRVQENGLSYLVDLDEGLNTGLFADQRRNRLELMPHCRGKRVLNLFAFTGAFSVAAAAAGASKVTSVDVSEKYLAVARENFALNRLNPKRHEFIVEDVFAALARLAREQRRFDLIIFDPPSFSTTRKSRFSTQGGTARLVAATLPLLENGGLLASSSNHQKVSFDDYFKELRKGAAQVGAELTVTHMAGAGGDFPSPVAFPEGRYLKFVISVKR